MQDEFEYIGQTGFQSACTEYAQKNLSLDDHFAFRAPKVYWWRATGGRSKKIITCGTVSTEIAGNLEADRHDD